MRQIDLTLMMMAPAECHKFANSQMAGVENNAQQGKDNDTHRRESLFKINKDQI